MIPFNKPCVIGEEKTAIETAIHQANLSGNGPFGEKCTEWLKNSLGCNHALLTPSCTAALEMTALLTEVQPGDEVIMPSYTFVSTANAFVLRGATIRFVDVNPETMNISAEKVEAAVTEQTKVIIVVHYAGIACDMDTIMEVANEYNLWVVEDAAQSLMSTYNGIPLGTIGHFGTISFHETKNITCGEGGALLINEASLVERAEILQEKGTNRKQFNMGKVDKYTWQDIGSSYLLSELNAAYLSVQLAHADEITENRLQIWNNYKNSLQKLADLGKIDIPTVPSNCTHNAHIFYIKSKDSSSLMTYLQKHNCSAIPHYVPLHTSHAGRLYGRLFGEDRYTTSESERLLRLPLYYGMEKKDVGYVVNLLYEFYQI